MTREEFENQLCSELATSGLPHLVIETAVRLYTERTSSVFIIHTGEYSSRDVEGVFTTREAAERYLRREGFKPNPDGDGWSRYRDSLDDQHGEPQRVGAGCPAEGGSVSSRVKRELAGFALAIVLVVAFAYAGCLIVDEYVMKDLHVVTPRESWQRRNR